MKRCPLCVKWYVLLDGMVLSIQDERFLRKFPAVSEGKLIPKKRAAMDAWGHGDFLCRNYILNEGMKLSEILPSTAMIEKLPTTIEGFQNYLKHKRKEIGLEDLIVRLRIEENNRLSEMKIRSCN
ncbi:hypothetical protein Sango_1739000 [Sesamum angolense]|uniref:Uncharacterized protein n=1 Tax=Sesamum angolense TaxID=2727404 RepID=A0AAE1WMJ3_9LAMI|nr:hypothetical protein Sango_1739000 [Sesamum angolense]